MHATATRAWTVTRRALTPSAVHGLAIEALWSAAHLALYPLGVADEALDAQFDGQNLRELDPVHRGMLCTDLDAAGTPILLVHGMVDNRSIFTFLRRALRRRGFGRVCTMNYSVFTSDVRTAAKELGERIEELCRVTGYDQIHVIGHSMGGVISRYYVQRLGGDSRVHTLVTMGSPHGGTELARLLPLPLTRQLRPDSDVVAELREPAPGCRTRFVAIWSDLDQLMLPLEGARIDHPDLTVRNVRVPDVGHMSLPVNGRVVREVVATLAKLDHDGRTVAGGVTSLAERRAATRSKPGAAIRRAAAPA